MSKENLKFWNSVEKTDPKQTKKAKLGGIYVTAINAMYQIKNATEQWGMYGATWGLKEIKYDYIHLGNETVLAVVSSKFFYPGGEFEIGSSIKVQYKTAGANSYIKIDDDFVKKVETDMTTKALSKLGFNADVFQGRYDDNRYVNLMQKEFAETKIVGSKVLSKKQIDSVIKKLETDFSLENIAIIQKWLNNFKDNADRKRLQKIIDDAKA